MLQTEKVVFMTAEEIFESSNESSLIKMQEEDVDSQEEEEDEANARPSDPFFY